jgi:hypothetical protein
MEKNEKDLWIIDELVDDPHLPDRVVVRDGAKWWIIAPGKHIAPVAYKAKMSTDYLRLTYSHEYLFCDCVPRDGFRVEAKRIMTDEEFSILRTRLNLTDDDVSEPFTDRIGSIYGPDTMIEFSARQIQVGNQMALTLESELLGQGIQASCVAAGRLNIRVVDKYHAGIGAKGGSAKSPAKSKASAANGAKGGRPPKARTCWDERAHVWFPQHEEQVTERAGKITNHGICIRCGEKC